MTKRILGIGNPLLDISVHVDQAYLEKVGFELGTAALAEEKDLPMFKEIVTFPDVQYIPGGACQNAIRGAQWLSPIKGITHFIGSIGDDENGEKLKQVAENDGVQTHYYVSSGSRTGCCAVLVKDKERALIADLAAANEYKHSHFESVEIQQVLNECSILCGTGFFLTVSPETLVALGEHCLKNNKLFIFSIAAPFVCEFFWEKLQAVIPYVDLLLGNKDEGEAFFKKAGIPFTDWTVAVKMASELPKKNPNRKRTIVFTQGQEPTITYHNGKHELYPVEPIERDEIEDTNGAGDGFMGGLLIGHALDKPFEECMRAARFAARYVLTVSGTNYSKTCDFVWK